MSAMTESAGPPASTRTQKELDDSFRESYWILATEYGLHYYVSGRFAVTQRFRKSIASDDRRLPSFELMLPQVDRLMGLLFKTVGGNPDHFLREIKNDKWALDQYDKIRVTLLGEGTP